MKTILIFLIFFGIPPGSTIQELIAKYEGWGVKGSLTHKLHNPGALSFAHQKGAVRGTGGYAKWGTDAEGWKALDKDLQSKIKR